MTQRSETAAATRRLTTHSAEETRALGERLGALAERGIIVLLQGDLGAGKTVLAQGVGRGLDAPTVVNSPTFVLLNEHLGGRLPLEHADLYRLTGGDEIAELALDEAAAEGVLLVEWPERAGGALPPDHLLIRIEPGDDADAREITLTAHGQRSRRLFDALRSA